jgi:FHA domain
MATYQCPKGHSSSDPDYCSECGALIGLSAVASAVPIAAAPAPASGASATSATFCPDCMTPRTPGARFCEVCRYDFEAGVGHQSASTAASAPSTSAPTAQPTVMKDAATTPSDVATPSSASAAPAVASVTTSTADSLSPIIVTSRLNVVVIADPSLAEDEETRQKCPQNEPELIFPLDLDENLLGRRSDNKKIYPEIDISDPGISHRHLKFIKQSDGTFAVLELGSANGTTLNGATLKPGLITPVKAGDEMIIGMWTRLQIRSR